VTSYRVAEEPPDPLAIDPALCRSLRFWQRFWIHSIATVLTFGLWLPGLVGFLVTSRRRLSQWASEYSVRIQGPTLVVGSGSEARAVPLDAIADVSASSGYTNVSIRGSQPLQIYGLRDPLAAARAILDARDAHLRSLRGGAVDEVLEAEAGAERVGGRRR
jgi:hypothetical protein